MSNIAIIPARGGSKRIPRKNIKNFSGSPMINYAIKAARDSGLFSHILVSTDDQEIASVALECGAEVPFIRPDNLSDDYTPTVPVIAHAISECVSLGWSFDYVCCLYPSIPFINENDLMLSLDLLLANPHVAYSFPVSLYPTPIQRALRMNNYGMMTPFQPQYELVRTQDLELSYHDAGQYYWGHTKSWLTKDRIHNNGIGLPIPSWRVIDIDTMEDWIRAEMIYTSLFTRR